MRNKLSLKHILLLAWIFLSACGNNYSQQFQKTIGGSNIDALNSCVQLPDGSIILAGMTISYGIGTYYDEYIVKISQNGSLISTKTLGAPGYDYPRHIIQTYDGGYITCGWTSWYTAGLYDIYIVKFSSTGTVQWGKTAGGGNTEDANSIIQTSDSGFVAAGETSSIGAGYQDFYIIKLSKTGALNWTRTVGGPWWDVAHSIIHAFDNGFIVAGNTESFGAGNKDMYVVKLDTSGALLWTRTIGGSNLEEAYSVTRTPDSGYVVAGTTKSFGAGGEDAYFIKLNKSGILQWTRTIGGTGNEDIKSIISTSDGGIIAAGRTNSFGAGVYDGYIVKLDSSGNLQWTKVCGGTGQDNFLSIIRTIDGNYLAVGQTNSFGAGNWDGYIVKIDQNGNTCNAVSGGNIGSGGSSGSGGTIGTGGTSTTPVITQNTGGILTDICVTNGINPISNEVPADFKLYQNYSNPFNPSTKIRFDIPPNGKWQTTDVKLIVYDILGREVATLVNEQLKPGTYEVEWDGSNFTSGIYFYRLVTDSYGETKSFTDVKKMVLVK